MRERVAQRIAVVARARREQRDAAPLRDGDRARGLRGLVREARHRAEREQIAHDRDARRPLPLDAEIARERRARLQHRLDEQRRERAIGVVLVANDDAVRVVLVDDRGGGDARATAPDVGDEAPLVLLPDVGASEQRRGEVAVLFVEREASLREDDRRAVGVGLGELGARLVVLHRDREVVGARRVPSRVVEVGAGTRRPAHREQRGGSGNETCEEALANHRSRPSA